MGGTDRKSMMCNENGSGPRALRVEPCLLSQPSRSGLKKVNMMSSPSSTGILNGSFLMLL